MALIPKRIFRTVPQETTVEAEGFWKLACDLHPGWEMVTYRDPIDPKVLPLSTAVFDLCKNGAQRAGFIRLEALMRFGGIYLDSDVELYRPLDSLLHCSAFAGWEDPNTVPDAVLGATVCHPAIVACLELAGTRIHSTDPDWRTGNGAWSTGPGVTTAVLPGRADVLLLPPGAFYPVHYSEKENLASHEPKPWCFGLHHYAASWL